MNRLLLWETELQKTFIGYSNDGNVLLLMIDPEGVKYW